MLPAAAAAETVVPPGNSAATQYTEAFPTSGGNAKTNSGINGDASPAKVLGSGNAKKLESKGQVGHEVADLAAETAPAQVTSEGGSSAKPAPARQAKAGGHKKGDSSASGGVAGGGKPQGGGGAGAEGAGSGASAGSGSSGFGEVLSQATGSGSGQLGLFLPLIVIGTLIWSLNFLWRQRRQAG
jgi:hypothetical protein